MKENTSNKNKGKHEGVCVEDCLATQEASVCPSAAGLLTPVDGQTEETAFDKVSQTLDRGDSMAESVTRHTLISDIDKIEYLTCGIDTLDVGFYVTWGENWKELRQDFDGRKSCAQGQEGNLIDIPGIRPHVFYAGGKAPNYRYHIKFPEYHCFIAISPSASRSPNVYISFTSEALHLELSEIELIELVTHDIESFGGHVTEHKISRCDLYADFRIPDGLNLDFLKSHMVGKAKHTSHFMNGDLLETFYVGQKSSNIQLRLYDKGKEIKKKGTEERWLLIWFVDDPKDVWRIEFQIRRKILNEYHIDSINDLRNKKADLWKYATGEWFSLRCIDDENQARRTIHPLWEKVQSCIEYFGSVEGTKREYEKKKATSIRWHVLRISNLLIVCAAYLKDYDLESCAIKVFDRILLFVDRDEFKEKARKKSVESGVSIENEVKAGIEDIKIISNQVDSSHELF